MKAKTTPRKNSKNPAPYDVVIVGAGIAGLACAQELLKQNFSVLILEGRNRVGGRISTWSAANFSSVPSSIKTFFL